MSPQEYQSHRPKCRFVLVEDECDSRRITIRDDGMPGDTRVTDDLDRVVYWLYINGILGDPDRPLRLFYYDYFNRYEEVIHNGKGEFVHVEERKA